MQVLSWVFSQAQASVLSNKPQVPLTLGGPMRAICMSSQQLLLCGYFDLHSQLPEQGEVSVWCISHCISVTAARRA